MYKELKQFGKVKVNEPMAKHTTFKIGGPAEFFVIVEDTQKLIELLKFLDGEGIPHFILGGGSNMLVRNEGFQGVVIEVKSQMLKVDGTIVEADAGFITAKLAHEIVKAGLTGFEWGVGVPGTIGGAVRGNAGAMGKEMKDCVKEVEVYSDGEVVRYTNAECEFGYRHSIFKDQGGVILRVWLELEKSESHDGMKMALDALKYRNETQPKGFASTGCIFKNADISELVAINKEQAAYNKAQMLKHFGEQDEKVQQFLKVGKISAGWLVEQAGMKGKRVGQAEVSPVHGNFIVNLGGATSDDVLTLLDEVKQKVYSTYGIELEEEIQIV